MWGKMASQMNSGVASAIAPEGVLIKGNGSAKHWMKVQYCGGWGYLENVNEMIEVIDK